MEQKKSKILIITESFDKDFHLNKLKEILKNIEINGKGFKFSTSIKNHKIKYNKIYYNIL